VLRVSGAAEAPALATGAGLIGLLAKMEEVQVVCGGEDPAPAGVGVVGTVEIFLPMKGLVDLEREKARLDKELSGIEGWIKGCTAKLTNEKFTANAPAQVIRQQRDLLADNEAKAARIRERIAALD
jgi:valyl-tRNA synthetase